MSYGKNLLYWKAARCLEPNVMTQTKPQIIIIVLALLVSITMPAPAEKSPAADKYSIFSFSVHGATCVACIMEINRLLRGMKGVKAVNINQTKRPLTVALVLDQSVIQADTIVKALELRKYQVMDLKTIAYNKTTVGQYLVPAGQVQTEEEKPNLVMP